MNELNRDGSDKADREKDSKVSECKHFKSLQILSSNNFFVLYGCSIGRKNGIVNSFS